MKKLLIVLCTLVSVFAFADGKILQSILLPDMSVYYECDFKALNSMPGLEEKLEKMENAPLGDAIKINEATEKMIKALGLDPKKDVLKLNWVAALSAEQLSGMQKDMKLDKLPFCGAVETAKAIDVAAAPEAITAFMSEVGNGGSCTPFKVGEMTALKLKMPPSKQMKLEEVSIVFPRDGMGLIFGTEELVRSAAERYVSGKINQLPFTFEELKKISKPNSQYSLFFKSPLELQNNLRSRAVAQMQVNPMEAGLLGEIANVTGFSLICNANEKGLDIIVSTLLPTPENAMSFKNTLLDGMVKPLLSMLVLQYAQQQLEFIEGMKTSLEGKVARVETTITYDDLKSITGFMSQLPQH